MPRPGLLVLLSACGAGRAPEDPAAWFDSGVPYTVDEPVAFTDQPYGLPATPGEGIGDRLLPAFPQPSGSAVSEADLAAGLACAGWRGTSALPVEVTGVVTVLPQFYYKSSGCGDDEKFYTSYFVEDDTGGVMILHDARMATFDAGATITLRVRSVSRTFDNNLVYSHEVLNVDRDPVPVRYVESNRPFEAADVGRVQRVTGTILAEPDGFGTFYVEPDGAEEPCIPPASDEDVPVGCAIIGLSTELNRRPIEFPAGSRIIATGPIVSSFGYKLVVTRLGQIEFLSE